LDYFQVVATISMIIQIVVLVLLFIGIWLKGTKKFRQHGIAMLAAVALHTVTIVAWMVPSFSSIFTPSGAIDFADVLTVAIMTHAVTGIAAAILGIWLVASWRLKTDMKTCFAKKSAMRVTITLWLIALAIGVILYLKVMQLF
jgi:uncharacterized membrane protein YozB (DUF420 family)